MLRGSDIPQINSLSQIREIVAAIASGNHDARLVAQETGLSLRHTSYGIAACTTLGFILNQSGEPPIVLTPFGASLLRTTPGSKAERVAFTNAINSSATIRAIAPGLLGSVAPSVSQVKQNILAQSELSPATAARRAACVLSWRRQIINEQGRLPLGQDNPKGPPSSTPPSPPLRTHAARALKDISAHSDSLRTLSKSSVTKSLSEVLSLARDEAASVTQAFFFIAHANDLSRSISILSSCGLQKDILKKMVSFASFNESWEPAITPANSPAEWSIRTLHSVREPTSLTKQMLAVFGTHKQREFLIRSTPCDDHDYIIMVESHRKEGVPFLFDSLSQDEAVSLSEKLFLAILKEERQRHVSDWEKVVHELASPLDFIYSRSDFYKQVLLSDRDVRLRAKKLEDFKLMSRLLVNRLHMFRYLFAGVREPLEFTHVNVFDVAMPVTHLWHHEARPKGLRFKYDELKDRGTVKTDKDTIYYILFNLVSNAIKYSDERTEIELYAYRRKQRFCFGVRNRGIEIDDAEYMKIFERGYRSEEARRRDARGVGVGLAVTRQMVEAIGGRIRTFRDSGRTVFEVEIPDR